MGKKALAGVKVLEYARFVAAPYCAKLLADLGAEVIKIEEPGKGDDARRYGPFPNDIPHPEKSGLFLYLNTNKLGITLNLASTQGQRVFKRLVETADIFIEDNPPRQMEEMGLGYQALKEVNPKLIMTSITPFGQNGPYADYKAYYLNTYHSSILGYLTTPDPECEPLGCGGLMGEYICGLSASVAILGALYFQRLGGQGQHVDVSKQETLLSYGRMDAARYPNERINPPRKLRGSGGLGMTACSDGYVLPRIVEDSQWTALVQLLGNPDWASDERYATVAARAENLEEVAPFVSEWMSTRSKEEIYHLAQTLGSPITPVMTAEDVLNSPQSKAREFFCDIDHPEAGEFKYPSSPYRFSKTPWGVERPAPRLGEHNEEVLAKRLGYSPDELAQMARARVI